MKPFQKYQRVPPTIPSALLIKPLMTEPPCVVSGFLKIVLWWCQDREPEKPLDSKLRVMSCLPDYAWQRHGKRIKELLDEFYEPFLNHWITRNRKAVKSALNAEKGRDSMKRARSLLKQGTRLADESNRDAERRPTYIPEGFSQSPNFDAKAREKLIKAKKRDPNEVWLKD